MSGHPVTALPPDTQGAITVGRPEAIRYTGTVRLAT
jgi:hypothetical protein